MKDDARIDLLREVKEVLDKHEIEFWLTGGTLLGAVRDGRFISWDPDIDFGTWYTNLSGNAMRLVAKELSDKGFKTYIQEIPTPHMHVQHREEEVYLDLNFWRLIDDKAIVPAREPRRLIGTFLSYFSEALSTPYLYEVDFRAKPYIRNFIKRILVKVSRALPSLSRMRLARIVAAVYEKIGTRDVSRVVPADHFRDLSVITFYGMEFRVPAKTEEYLVFKYGENWRIPRRDWVTNRDDGNVISNWKKRKRESR